jgi:hypothetical protein
MTITTVDPTIDTSDEDWNAGFTAGANVTLATLRSEYDEGWRWALTDLLKQGSANIARAVEVARSAAGLLPLRRPTPTEMAFARGGDDAVRLVAMWLAEHPGYTWRELKAFIREARSGALQPVV